LLPKSPDIFVWTSIIYDIFGVNTYIVPKINDLLRERLTKANFPLYFINNSNCVLCDEVVQASIYFSKTHYLNVEVADKDFEDSLGSIVVSALALSQMKNVSKVTVVQEEWDEYEWWWR
jgi:hypothetical protein